MKRESKRFMDSDMKYLSPENLFLAIIREGLISRIISSLLIQNSISAGNRKSLTIWSVNSPRSDIPRYIPKNIKKILDFDSDIYICVSRSFFCYPTIADLRIWCNWCSIADFSSVRTGSSPVIRYLLLFQRHHGKTNHNLISSSRKRLSYCLFLLISLCNILRDCSVRQESLRHKKWICSLWFRCQPYRVPDSFWCDTYKFSYRESWWFRYITCSIIPLWGDGRAVNCIRL